MRSSDGSDRPLITQTTFADSPVRFFMNPAISPDGTQLVFTRVLADGQVRTWILSLAAGSLVRLNESATDSEIAGTWSPDGRRFAEVLLAGYDQALVSVKVGTREKPFVIRDHTINFVPDWSRDGKWLTYFDRAGWGLVSPDGKTVRPLGNIATRHLAFSKDSKLLYGIREENGKTTLFSINIATLKSTDIHELGKDLAPAASAIPSIRFSLTPDGKSITYATATSKSNLWLLEGFRQPGLLSRLGLTRPR
jgi:Tol biopolymer transport system component